MLQGLQHSVIPRFDYRVRHCVAKDQGSRKTDQDRYLCEPPLGLFAVADGMGGGQGGDAAAEAALFALKQGIADDKTQRAAEAYVQSPELEHRRYLLRRLRRAVEQANLAVRQLAHERNLTGAMGTTLDVVWLVRSSALVAHAGDSRVYLARARTLLQLTHDHGQLDAMKAEGLVKPTARGSSSGLLNAVGLRDDILVDTLYVELSRGDRLLLCTDGVYGELSGETELAEFMRGRAIEPTAQALVGRAGRTRRDNATALLVEVGDAFVTRSDPDRGLSAKDLSHVEQSPLLADLPRSLVLQALAAAVELEVEAGGTIPCVVANDLVSYLVLEGTVRCAQDRQVTTGALLFGSSLVGVWKHEPLPVAEERCRLLRIRYDDFREVCSDPGLGSELYRRLAAHLARSG